MFLVQTYTLIRSDAHLGYTVGVAAKRCSSAVGPRPTRSTHTGRSTESLYIKLSSDVSVRNSGKSWVDVGIYTI